MWERQLHHQIQSACRLRRAFLSHEFRERLASFSVWSSPMRQFRSLRRSRNPIHPGPVDLLDDEAVRSHMIRSANDLHARSLSWLSKMARDEGRDIRPDLPPIDEDALLSAARDLVAATNGSVFVYDCRSIREGLAAADRGLAIGG